MDNNDNFLKDENGNKKGTLPEGHGNKSRIDRFIWGFLITLLPYAAMFFSYEFNDNGFGMVYAFFLSLLFIIIGILLWAIIYFGFKKHSLALGFLVGGLATLLVLFIFTGGCGTFVRP